LLALDLVLVWTLWPGYRSGWGVRLWPKMSWWLALPGVLSAAALAYAVMVATFPDEQIYVATDWLHGTMYLDLEFGILYSPDAPKLYRMIAPANTLDLRGEDLIDDAKLTHILEKNESPTGVQRWVATLSLAGRDLTGANLESADIRHADFSEAILNFANLNFAWATKARFNFVQLQGASFLLAQLQGASFSNAQLQGANLTAATLRGASLYAARLPGAWLSGAHLQGALLDYAYLRGAWLSGAHLQGALLDYAYLRGAWLNHT
jgi:hypothetical protein